MDILKFRVRGQALTLINPNVNLTPVTDTVNQYLCQFEFSEDWDYLNKVVVFKNVSYNIAKEVHLSTSNECYIPWEVLSNSGEIFLEVIGTEVRGEVVTVRIPSTLLGFKWEIQEGLLDVSANVSPTPDLFEQFVSSVREDSIVAATARDEAVIARDVAVQSAADASASELAATSAAESAVNSASTASSAASSASESALSVAGVADETKSYAEIASAKAADASTQAEIAAGAKEAAVTAKNDAEAARDVTLSAKEIFDNNAETKLTTYNQNASEKTASYNANATEKLNSYNSNAQNKTSEFDAHTEQIQMDISGLKSDLSDIVNVIEPINLYNGEVDKGYIEYSGEFVSDNNFRASKLKLYKAGSYLFKKAVGVGVGLYGIVFKYTSDGVFDSRISGTLLENDIYKITILSDSYLRFNIGNDYQESFMIVKGTTINDYPTSYQPYFEPIFKLSENMKKIVVGKELKESINKYNGEYEKGYITYSGVYTADASYECTKLQKYTKGSYLYFSASGLGDASISRVFFYDAYGNYLKASNGISLSESIYKITFDSDVYVRFNMGNIYAHNTFMVVEGTTLYDFPETYQPYFDSYEAIEENVKVNETIRTQMANTSCLYKKSITFNGDSICYGAGEKGGYGKIIAKNNDMEYQNIGVSGATIAANTYSGDGSARHWICRTISNMNELADYAIVEGGVNDYSQSVPLGTLSTGYNAQLDDTTYYGAFESMLKQLTIRFKGKKIGYILVPQMVNGMRPNGAYYNATIECLKKWCVPYIDMSYLVPPFIDFTSDGDADLYAMRQTYTFNGDGTHPTKEGYEKYYVGKIEAWLKTL